MPHPVVESGVYGLHHQMVVIRHLAVSVDYEIEPLARGSKNPQPGPSISIVVINRSAPVASGRDVVQGIIKLETKGTGHRTSVATTTFAVLSNRSPGRITGRAC